MISAVILLSHLLCCLAEVQRECPATERCLPQNNCPEFLEKRERFNVTKDPKLLTELRSQVCDSAEKKVCCEKSVDSGQPLSTRSTEPLKNKTEEPLTTGQCGQAQIVPANVRLRDWLVTNREICIFLSDHWRWEHGQRRIPVPGTDWSIERSLRQAVLSWCMQGKTSWILIIDPSEPLLNTCLPSPLTYSWGHPRIWLRRNGTVGPTSSPRSFSWQRPTAGWYDSQTPSSLG